MLTAEVVKVLVLVPVATSATAPTGVVSETTVCKVPVNDRVETTVSREVAGGGQKLIVD